MNMEASETSHSIKVSRFDGHDDKIGRHQITGMEDLHFAMQPPRPSSKGPTVLQSSTFMTDLSLSNPRKWDCSRQSSLNMGLLGPAQGHYNGANSERRSGNGWRETALTPQMCLPPADEGSRTGLKGSGVASLLNNGSATASLRGTGGPSQTPGRSELLSHNIGTCHRTMAMTSRQLTIFYGGQAHVFDDVSPEKAEEIISSAGSSGRSWSTTYASRPRASMTSSASAGSLAAFERERDKAVNKSSAVSGFGNFTLSSDLNTTLSATPTPSLDREPCGLHYSA
eukprot:c26965_g1_i1 orf=720-1568(-)